MPIIDIHKLTLDIEGVTRRYEKNLNNFIQAISVHKNDPNWPVFGTISGMELDLLSRSIILNRQKPEIFLNLFYTLQYGINHFIQALNPGKEVVLNIGQSQVKAVGKETKDYISDGHWQNLYCLALILRDKNAIDFLQNIPNDFMRNSNISRDDQDFAVVDVFKSIFKETELKKSIQNYWQTLTIVKGQTVERKNFNKFITDPFINVLETIYNTDYKTFNTELEKALLMHKEFYQTDRKSSDPFGWISYNLISACCIAHDLGLKIEVESDYLPQWMIEGNFTGCELMVK